MPKHDNAQYNINFRAYVHRAMLGCMQAGVTDVLFMWGLLRLAPIKCNPHFSCSVDALFLHDDSAVLCWTSLLLSIQRY